MLDVVIKNGIIVDGTGGAPHSADICIFDANKITDKADFVSCGLRAEGLSYVFVGGVCVARNAVYTGKKPGKVLLKK